jgi:hypothetical protein
MARQQHSEDKTMTEREALALLISAIEDIQFNWENGDLAQMVREAIGVKDEICQQFNFPSTAEIQAQNVESES